MEDNCTDVAVLHCVLLPMLHAQEVSAGTHPHIHTKLVVEHATDLTAEIISAVTHRWPSATPVSLLHPPDKVSGCNGVIATKCEPNQLVMKHLDVMKRVISGTLTCKGDSNLRRRPRGWRWRRCIRR